MEEKAGQDAGNVAVSGGKRRARPMLYSLVGLAAVSVLGALAVSLMPVTGGGLTAKDVVALRARSAPRTPRAHPALYAVEVTRFESHRRGGDRELLGPGFTRALGDSLRADAWEFDACRARFVEGNSPVRLHVKVDATRARLRVVGMPYGPEENPRHAECVRDSLERLRFPFLLEVPPVAGEDYVLAIDVSPAVMAGSPVTLPGSGTL